MTRMIRIMIADDHQLFREGVTGLFKKSTEIKVIGEAANGRELVDIAEKLKPDVILTDIKMPMMDGIQATSVLSKSCPKIKMIALSMFNEDNLIIDMMEAGAKGYLLKNTHKNDIIDAIKTVFNNNMYYCKDTSDKLIRMMAKSQASVSNVKPESFNAKEKEIIKNICDGLSNKEMSDILHLSVRTIEGYRNKMYEKMGVKNTAGIVVYAIRNGMYSV